MFYQNYEDYIRSILGYPVESNTYEAYMRQPSYEAREQYNFQSTDNSELMKLYPEIYNVVNPMVRKICEGNTKTVDRDLIEKMSSEIYSNLEMQPDKNGGKEVRQSAVNNNILQDLIKILLLNQLLNQNRPPRPGPPPPPRPPMPPRPPRPPFPREDRSYNNYLRF